MTKLQRISTELISISSELDHLARFKRKGPRMKGKRKYEHYVREKERTGEKPLSRKEWMDLQTLREEGR